MPTPHDILFGIALPAVLAGILLVVAWKAWRRGNWSDGRWATPLAIVGLFIWAEWWFVHEKLYPPLKPDNWLNLFAAGAAALGMFDIALRPPIWLRVPIVFIIGGGLVRLLLAKVPEHLLPMNQAYCWTAGLATVITLWWLAMTALAARSPGFIVPLILALTAAATANLMFQFGIANRGSLPTGSLVAGCMVATVVGIRVKTFSLERGSVLVVALLLIGMIVYGYFWTPDDTVPAKLQAASAIIVISPLLAWIGEVPFIKRAQVWQRVSLQLVVVIFALAVAAWFMVPAESAAAGSSPDPGY